MSRLETEDARCPVCGHDNRVRVNGKGAVALFIIKNRYLIRQGHGTRGVWRLYIGMDLSRSGGSHQGVLPDRVW
jgi:hypothetical protein